MNKYTTADISSISNVSKSRFAKPNSETNIENEYKTTTTWTDPEYIEKPPDYKTISRKDKMMKRHGGQNI